MQKVINIKGLRQYLDKIIEQILDKIVDEIKMDVDEKLSIYYAEYEPMYYERINKLKECCKITQAKINGNKVVAQVYLDIDSLTYPTKGAEGYKTAFAGGFAGLHGGWDHSQLQNGGYAQQVPWDSIQDAVDGHAYGSGTRFWYDELDEMIIKKGLIDLFIEKAKQHGLIITKK